MNRKLALIGLAAALCFARNLLAQDNGGANGGGGQTGQGRRGGGNGGGRGNFDPAQMQQRMMERVRTDLGFTNDTEWNAVQPLVQKVMDARRDVGFGGRFRRGGGGNGGDNGNQDNGPRRGGFGEPSPEADALQKAIEANAPAAQIKSLLQKYRDAQKDKQSKLEQAQSSLRKVLTTKQEAQAVLLGLLS